MSRRTYANPVHDGYLGDPFVLEHNGEYYAYGTVPLGALAVPVLHSRDLTSWRSLGDALALDDDAFDALWAPEVAYDNGVLYMYYSAGPRGRATGYAWRRHRIPRGRSRTPVRSSPPTIPSRSTPTRSATHGAGGGISTTAATFSPPTGGTASARVSWWTSWWV